MKNKRIKWGNVIILAIFIVSVLFVINDFITLTINLASLTYYGFATEILALLLIDICGEHLYDEMR